MSMQVFKTEKELKLFKNQLSGLLLEELLFLFIESKTGDADDVNSLPDNMLEAMQDMGNELNKIYANKLKQEVF